MKPLEELRKEGEAGQRKINQYTRYGTVHPEHHSVDFGIALYLESLHEFGGRKRRRRRRTTPGWWLPVHHRGLA